MHSVFSGSAPVSPGPSQHTHTITSESAVHLREQVRIVSELYQQRQYDLSPPEREWIQNAITYTQQIIDPFFSTHNTKHGDDSAPKRFRALQALTLRSRPAQPSADYWNSRFLIAMQNLNSAMNMLSWSVHASQSAPNSRGLYESGGTPVLPGSEIRSFLSRRRLRRDDVAATGSQDVIAELRATNSLTQNTTRNKSSELPLTLVETVELWRENAEDALKDAMLLYFEQEEMLRGRVEPTVPTAMSPVDEEGHTIEKTDATRPATPPKDSPAAVRPARNDTQKRLSVRHLGQSSSSSGVLLNRKPLAAPSLDLSRNNLASTSPAVPSSLPTSSSLSSAQSMVSSAASTSAQDTDVTSTAPSPRVLNDDERKSTTTPTPESVSVPVSSDGVVVAISPPLLHVRRPLVQLSTRNNFSPPAPAPRTSSLPAAKVFLDVQPESCHPITTTTTKVLAQDQSSCVTGGAAVAAVIKMHQKSRGRMRLERLAAACDGDDDDNDNNHRDRV